MPAIEGGEGGCLMRDEEKGEGCLWVGERGVYEGCCGRRAGCIFTSYILICWSIVCACVIVCVCVCVCEVESFNSILISGLGCERAR